METIYEAKHVIDQASTVLRPKQARLPPGICAHRSIAFYIPSSLHVPHRGPAIPVNIQSPETLATRFLQAHPQAQIFP